MEQSFYTEMPFSESMRAIVLSKAYTTRSVLKYICALLNTHQEAYLYVEIKEDEFPYLIENDLKDITPNPTEYVRVIPSGTRLLNKKGVYFGIYVYPSSLSKLSSRRCKKAIRIL